MRSVVAFVLLLLGALLVPVATVAWWAAGNLVSADGFVTTMTPLSSDPAVTREVEDRLVEATTSPLEARLGGSADAVRPLVRLGVTSAVADPVFGRAWDTASREAHTQLVAVLDSDADPDQATIGVRLAPLSSTVRRQLVEAGVPLAGQLPTVRATLPLVSATHATRARPLYRFVDDWGRVLPLAALALIGLGLLVARSRGRAVAWTGLTTLFALGALAAVLVLARVGLPAAVPDSVPIPVGDAVFDAVTAGLWRDLAVVAVATLLAMIGGLVLGRRSRPTSLDRSRPVQGG